MDQREKDVLSVCKQVLSAYPNVHYNSNGSDTSTCPFCFAEVRYDESEMENLPHKLTCAYIIAKDLTTNLIS